MNRITRHALAFSLVAFAGATAHAQSQQQPSSQQPAAQQQSQSTTGASSQDQQSSSSGASAQTQGQTSGQKTDMSNLSVEKLMDMKVVDKSGKEIGQIDDVVIDLQSGKVHAAVLSFGGILGIGDKSYAFPVSELQQGKQQGQLTMNVDKQKLENADGFAKGQWPEMDSEYWGRVGQQASAGTGGQSQASQGGGSQGAQGKQLVRASELKGKQVQDKSGQDVGEIEDVFVDLKSGQVKNIRLNVADAKGSAEIQPSALSRGTGDKLVLDMDADQVKQQAKQKQSQGQQGGSASAGSGSTSGQTSSSDNPSAGSSGGSTTPPAAGSSAGSTATPPQQQQQQQQPQQPPQPQQQN